MPLLEQDFVNAALDARPRKTVTIPIFYGDILEQMERKGLIVPEISITFIPTAVDSTWEQSLAQGPFQGSMVLIESVVTEWDLQRRRDDGETETWPLSRRGLLDLEEQLPMAVIGIAAQIQESMVDGPRGKGRTKGSSTGSRPRSSTRARP